MQELRESLKVAKSRHVILVLFLIIPALIYADASTAYVTPQSGGRGVNRIDLTTGNVSMIAGFLFGGLSVALTNPSTAYAVGIVGVNNNNLYRVDLTNGNVFQVNNSSVAGAALDGLALSDETLAYIGGFHDGNLYTVNLLNGNVSLITPSPVFSGGVIGVALDMTLKNPKIAYALAAGNSGGVYRVDLANGNVSQVTSIAGATLRGIALANNSTAYITDFSGNNIYCVDLTNGNVSLVTPSPIAGAGLQGIALVNNTTTYTVGSNNGAVYRVDLTTGNFSEVNSTSLVPSLVSIAVVLQIGTSGLTGNNLRFANYLNANAPQTTLPLLALQSDIAGALEIAAPTRNAIFTFAAQTTQLACGQQVYGHLAQKRWSKAWHSQPMQTSQTMPAQALLSRNQLFSDASDFINLFSESLPESDALSADKESENLPESDASVADSAEKKNIPETMGKKEEAHYSPWLGVFGEYTNERSQHQTPSFETGTGGFVLATDYRHIDIHPALLLGGGMAYAYTHVHEADGAGHANINQAALMFYGAWVESKPKWYVNWALWGGYYHANNVREINLPGIVGGSAISSTNGWQLTPHFEVGYDYEDNWFCVEPFDMIDWVACWERGFQEHGAGSLNMGQKGRFCSLLRNELGVRFNETLTYDWGTVTFREKGSYVYQKAFNTGVITAFLVGSAGSFVVSTLTGAQNLGAVEFESLFVPANKKYPYGTISYQGEFGSRYQSHQGMVTIGMDF